MVLNRIEACLARQPYHSMNRVDQSFEHHRSHTISIPLLDHNLWQKVFEAEHKPSSTSFLYYSHTLFRTSPLDTMNHLPQAWGRVRLRLLPRTELLLIL